MDQSEARKVGRRPKSASGERRSVQVPIAFAPAEAERLRAYARRHGLSLADAIVALMDAVGA